MPTDNFKNPGAKSTAALEQFERLSRLLDTQVKAPGVPFRFGLDGILGLIPGVGDLVTSGMGAYALLVARHHKLPWHLHARILSNLLFDMLVGAIPLVGDLFDFAFHAHRKNYNLLARAIEKRSVSHTQ